MSELKNAVILCISDGECQKHESTKQINQVLRNIGILITIYQDHVQEYLHDVVINDPTEVIINVNALFNGDTTLFNEMEILLHRTGGIHPSETEFFKFRRHLRLELLLCGFLFNY